MASTFLSKLSFGLAKLIAAQRVSIGLFFGIFSFFAFRLINIKPVTAIMMAWDISSLLLIIMSWIIFFYVPVNKMSELAQREDGSRTVIFFIVLVSLLISLFGILILRNSSENLINKELNTTVSMIGVALSWVLLHTVFTLHYAHMFYDDDNQVTGVCSKGLEFPEEDNPDYLDFAYFSFVIGMTFQVSDVEISARKIRRMALLHGIIAFLYNTIIVALTINILAN